MSLEINSQHNRTKIESEFESVGAIMRLSSSSLISCFLSLALLSHFPGSLIQVDAKPVFDTVPLLSHFGKYLSREPAAAPSRKLLPMAGIQDSEACSDGSSVESVRQEDWSTYYNYVSSNNRPNNESFLFAALIAHVRQIGPDIKEHHKKHEQEILDVVRITRDLLSTSGLKKTHRIWALGVVSCLKDIVPMEKDSSLVGKWEFKDLISRPVGDFELFLLKDHDLGGVVREIPPLQASDQEISDHVIKEALNRALIVNSINKDMNLGDNHRHRGFKKVLVSFMNLKTPIDDKSAKQLMKEIKEMLDSAQDFVATSPEEHFTIQMALHMEEHHSNSMIRFKELITNPKICTRILGKDFEFQLRDPELSPVLEEVLRSLMNNKTPKSESIRLALEATNDEKYPILHRARVIRVLNLMAKHDDNVYELVNKELNHSNGMIFSLSRIFLELSQGRMYPEKLQKNDLQYLVYQKEDKILTEERLVRLEQNLLTKKFLDPDIIEDVLIEFSENSQGSRTKGLTPIIKRLSNKLLSCRPIRSNQKLDEIQLDAIEYILHLILLEKDDVRLNINLVTRGTPFIQYISPKVFSVARSDPISLDARLKKFTWDLTRKPLSPLDPTSQIHSVHTPSFKNTVE